MSETIEQQWTSNLNQIIPIEIGTYVLIYSVLLKSQPLKNLSYGMFSIVCILAFFDFARHGGAGQYFDTISYYLAASFSIICLFLYLYQLFEKNTTKNIFNNFWFWISIGLFIFLASEMPIMSAINYLKLNKQVDLKILYNLWTTKLITGSLYYFTYIITLFLCKPKTQISY